MEYENCTKCPFHKEIPDPDPFDDLWNTNLAVQCLQSPRQPVQDSLGRYELDEPMITVGCRPYKLEDECERPQWCPLQLIKQVVLDQVRAIEVYHRWHPDIYDVYEMVDDGQGGVDPKHLFSRGAPDNVLTLLAELSEKQPIQVKFIDQHAITLEVTKVSPDGKAYVKVVPSDPTLPHHSKK